MTRKFLTPIEVPAIKLGASSTVGYVWTATDTAGNGSWQTPSGGGGTAATTVFTPSGNIAATDVQAALAEVDAEKVSIDGDQSVNGKKTFQHTSVTNSTAEWYEAATGNGTIGVNDAPILRYTGTGGHTWTLPTSSAATRQRRMVFNRGTGNLTIAAAAAEKFDSASGVTSIILIPGENLELYAGIAGIWYTKIYAAKNHGHTGSQIVFTPTGNIAASNVQNALAELDNEKIQTSGGTMTGPLVVMYGAYYNRLNDAALGLGLNADAGWRTYLEQQSLSFGDGSAGTGDWKLSRLSANTAALAAGDDLRRPSGEDGTHDDSMVRKAQLDRSGVDALSYSFGGF